MQETIGKNSNEWAITFNSIGVKYYNQNKHKQALGYYNKALKMQEKIGKYSNDWAITLKNIGNVYYNQNKQK